MAKMPRKVNKAPCQFYQPCVMKRISLPTPGILLLLAMALAPAPPLAAETVPKKATTQASSSSSSNSNSNSSSKSSPKAKSKSDSKSSKPGSSSSTSKPAASKSSSKASDEGREGGPRPVADEDQAGPPLAAVSSIEPEEIEGFDHYAPQVQELIRKALGLTRMNLTYTFGSADPKRGGMDCSGTIYYLLHDFGFKGVPRSSDLMCGWVQENTLLYRVQQADSLKHHEFASLQPGHLLFWSGTYNSAPRKIPVTHVMLYLGKLKKSGKHVVFGASDGRSYQGQRRTGVSVFDFSLPKAGSRASFYGYGLIPGIGRIKPSPPALAATTPPSSGPSPSTTSDPDSAATAGKPARPDTTKAKDTPKVTAQSPENTPTSASAFTEANANASTQSTKPKTAPASPTRSTADGTDDKAKKAAMTTAATQTDSPAVPTPTPPQEEIRKAQPAARTPTTAAAETTSTASKTKPTVSSSSNKNNSTTTTTPATRKKSSTASSRPSSSSAKTTTARRKQTAPAPPPTPMDRIRRAANSFANDVRRTFR